MSEDIELFDDEAQPQGNRYSAALAGASEYIHTLPPLERKIAMLAAEGQPIWEIAQHVQLSDGAVSHMLDSVVAMVAGNALEPVETGGLGADSDPGDSRDTDPPGWP